jgi:hypothetical protein
VGKIWKGGKLKKNNVKEKGRGEKYKGNSKGGGLRDIG